MDAENISKILKDKFGDKVLEVGLELLEPIIAIDPGSIAEVCQFLKDDEEQDFKFLMCLSGIDLDEENLQVVYHLNSMKLNHKITLSVTVPKSKPDVSSVANVWRTADWHEREAFDLLGVRFTGHPDMRRILCPDDWEGHPLRKDYIVPETYNDMPVPYPEEEDSSDKSE
jgi:NADH-quinone oxidoreductase subunit C